MSSTRVSYKTQELLTLPEHPSSSPFFVVGSVLLIALVFFVFSYYVFFTFWVPCCDVRYDFRVIMRFGSFLPPIVRMRTHVVFTLFLFVCIWWCPTHVVLVLFYSSCVPFFARFSGLTFLDCPFGILLRLYISYFHQVMVETVQLSKWWVQLNQ